MMCITFILAIGKPRQRSSLYETLHQSWGQTAGAGFAWAFYPAYSEQGGGRRMGKKMGWKFRWHLPSSLPKWKVGKLSFSLLNGCTQCAAFQGWVRKAKEEQASFTPPLRGKSGRCRFAVWMWGDAGGIWFLACSKTSAHPDAQDPAAQDAMLC